MDRVSKLKGGDVNIVIKHPGSLLDLGYSSKENTEKRHEALERCIEKYGIVETIRKVNAIAVLNKNRPVGKIFEKDLKYLEAKEKGEGFFSMNMSEGKGFTPPKTETDGDYFLVPWNDPGGGEEFIWNNSLKKYVPANSKSGKEAASKGKEINIYHDGKYEYLNEETGKYSLNKGYYKPIIKRKEADIQAFKEGEKYPPIPETGELPTAYFARIAKDGWAPTKKAIDLFKNFFNKTFKNFTNQQESFLKKASDIQAFKKKIALLNEIRGWMTDALNYLAAIPEIGEIVEPFSQVNDAIQNGINVQQEAAMANMTQYQYDYSHAYEESLHKQAIVDFYKDYSLVNAWVDLKQDMKNGKPNEWMIYHMPSSVKKSWNQTANQLKQLKALKNQILNPGGFGGDIKWKFA